MHNLSRINNSIPRSLEINQSRFPNREDYENYFFFQSHTKNSDDLWNNPNSVIMIQQHWHHMGQTGCVFAQSVAYKQESIGWDSEVIYDLSLHTRSELETKIANAIESKENEILSLLFPKIIDPKQLKDLIIWLCSSPMIKIGLETIENEVTLIGLRIPLNSDPVLSWLVGFAPMEHLPNTRRSPVTEIAIRTKPKPAEIFHRLNQNIEEAHLADIQLGYNEKVMEILWQATKKRANTILGGEGKRKGTAAASAKVTISIPTNIWVT